MARTGPPGTSSATNFRQAVKDDQRKIRDLFGVYLGSPSDSRQSIVEQILHQLDLHLELEASLFSQIRKSGTQGRKVVDVAEHEYEEIKAMILTLQQSEADDDQALDEFFEDMMQTVQAHFLREERDLLPLINPEIGDH